MPRIRDPQFDGLDELRKAVLDSPHGYVLCKGLDLRHAAGESRLKALARGRVEVAMTNTGLVAIPEVPEDQNADVYVTQQASPFAVAYSALTNPRKGDARLVAAVIRDVRNETETSEALEEAFELVDEVREKLDEVTEKLREVEADLEGKGD